MFSLVWSEIGLQCLCIGELFLAGGYWPAAPLAPYCPSYPPPLSSPLVQDSSRRGRRWTWEWCLCLSRRPGWSRGWASSTQSWSLASTSWYLFWTRSCHRKFYVVQLVDLFISTDPHKSSLMFFSLKVKYVQSLKEIAIDIPGQQVFFCLIFLLLKFTCLLEAISMDNVAINIDGILYLRIMDPYKVNHIVV